MKIRRMICLYAITLCVLGVTAYSLSGSDEAIVDNLICQRTDTLNDFYGGRLGKAETVEIIERIETEHQKEEDLQNINLYFQTDIEQVQAYEIEDIDITYTDEDMICANVTMGWILGELDENEDEIEVSYSVICKREENMYKLAQFF